MESRVTKTVLLGGAALIAYNLLIKGKALANINFEPGQVHSFGFDGFTPVLTVGIIAQNTSSQKFVVRSIAGEVKANSYYIGTVSFFGYSEILPNSQSEILIPIRLAAVGLVQDIINAFTTGANAQTIVFNGYANVDNYQVPINNKWKVGL